MNSTGDSRRLGGGRIATEGGHVESDRLFYMRRVTAVRLAAARAITVEARERRMVLVQSYLDKLQALSTDLTAA